MPFTSPVNAYDPCASVSVLVSLLVGHPPSEQYAAVTFTCPAEARRSLLPRNTRPEIDPVLGSVVSIPVTGAVATGSCVTYSVLAQSRTVVAFQYIAWYSVEDGVNLSL